MKPSLVISHDDKMISRVGFSKPGAGPCDWKSDLHSNMHKCKVRQPGPPSPMASKAWRKKTGEL